MMLLNGYRNKKELKQSVGQPLHFRETSIHAPEYQETGIIWAAHRPQITGQPGREFFAKITMKEGIIANVS